MVDQSTEDNYAGVWDNGLGFGEKSALIVIDLLQGYTTEGSALYAPGVIECVKEMPELLNPTIIYAELIKELLNEFPILGMAHITGGGLVENITRVLPDGLEPYIDWNTWTHPDIFLKIMDKGNVPLEEMKRVFNMGIGFVLIVPPECDYGVQIGEVCGSSS